MTVAEANRPRGIGRHVRFVRHHENRDAPVPIEANEKLHDLDTAGAVQIAGRLVREEHRRFGDDGACNRDALHLPPRELGGRVRLPPSQPHSRKRFARALRRSPAAIPR